jgi:hypothetical protein
VHLVRGAAPGREGGARSCVDGLQLGGRRHEAARCCRVDMLGVHGSEQGGREEVHFVRGGQTLIVWFRTRAVVTLCTSLVLSIVVVCERTSNIAGPLRTDIVWRD